MKNFILKNKTAIFTVILSFASVIFYLSPLTVLGKQMSSQTEIRPSELYARSAVLMDADTGRVLFSKNAAEEMPMASTTKIMTCILALENGNLRDRVTASNEAAAQPEVRLGMKSGESFYLKDLLYSLMLESHNDTATAIAEHIGGSVKGFADMMNEKAREIGCTSTYFITPNGLDASDENGVHHTTASDLGLIMRYCIMQSEKKEEFLDITRTASYSFTDCSETSSYSCTNHNSFLQMMEGALTGKTGFTADAGYCYVGALRRDDRTFIVALLACGWPNNKGYKWSDTMKLMTYGLDNYMKREITVPLSESRDDFSIKAENGYVGGFPQKESRDIKIRTEGEKQSILMKEGETPDVEYDLPSTVSSPVYKGQKLGMIYCYVDGKETSVYSVYADEDIMERTWGICFEFLLQLFFTCGSRT